MKSFARESTSMMCPSCGISELEHATLDHFYSYEAETLLIPTVTGAFCPACGEVITSGAEARRVEELKRRFRIQVHPTLKFRFAARLSMTQEDGLVATFRDIPLLFAEGRDIPDTLAKAADALGAWLTESIDSGVQIPCPSQNQGGEYLIRPSSQYFSDVYLRIRQYR